jgi:hypothetical protein
MTSSHGSFTPYSIEVIMKKCLATVVLCLSAFSASAGPITQSFAIPAAFSDPAGMALHILSMSPDDQHDLALWTASQEGARDLPVLWDGPALNSPVASVSSAPLRASPRDAKANMFVTPTPDPFAFLLLSVALSLCTYMLRRTRLSALPACG